MSAPAGLVVNSAPQFKSAVPATKSFTVGQEFTWTMPEIEDPDGDTFEVSVSLGAMAVFMTHADGVFSVAAGATSVE